MIFLLIQQIGAYAGLLAVVGLVLLALLYFSQARDVKRLREWAGRAPERDRAPDPAVKATPSQPVAESEGAKADPGGDGDADTEQPTTQTETPPLSTVPPARKFNEDTVEVYKPKRASLKLPKPKAPRFEPKYLVVALVVLAVVGAGAFAVVNLTGGDSGANKSAGGGSGQREPAVNPARVTVAVLNGTSTPGLASEVGKDLETDGFKVGTVTNASTSNFTKTLVLYKPGYRREAAFVAKKVKAKGGTKEMDQANSGLVGSAKVAVVAGQDKAPASSSQAPAAAPPATAPSTQQAAPPATGAVQ